MRGATNREFFELRAGGQQRGLGRFRSGAPAGRDCLSGRSVGVQAISVQWSRCSIARHRSGLAYIALDHRPAPARKVRAPYDRPGHWGTRRFFRSSVSPSTLSLPSSRPSWSGQHPVPDRRRGGIGERVGVDVVPPVAIRCSIGHHLRVTNSGLATRCRSHAELYARARGLDRVNVDPEY